MLILIVLIKVMAANMHGRRVVLVRQRIRAVRILGVNRDAEPVDRGKEKEERVSEGFGARRLRCAGGGGVVFSL
jgi:hypothetical protein